MLRATTCLFLLAWGTSNSFAAEAAKKNRNPAEIAARIDALIDGRLKQAGIPTSPGASDGEFLRRVSLDITGRIPTGQEAAGFLADRDPAKRRKRIDALLARTSYGEHFGAVWRERLAPPEKGKKKTGRDSFSPWLATQFNQNRGWNEIVTDLLTVEGRVREQPQTAFIMANSDNFDPQPNRLADATSRLFWGVQLRCAECHDHPFAPWKQADFWGTAAFFSRVRRGYTMGKNPAGWTITESSPDEPVSRKFGKSMAAEGVAGPAIVVSADAAKLQGNIVKGRFLSGAAAHWTDSGPFRPRFAAWATGKANPYFAPNTANRWWANFFGRGLVNPLDGFQPDNAPSHPEVLKLLADELIATDFDLKHLIRVICNTRAYQRTSRPAAGNQQDVALYSHMAVKPLRPEMLYKALSIALNPPQKKPGSGKSTFAPQVQPLPEISRQEFVRFFRSRDDERDSSQVNNGIPQLLRLMNGPLLNGRATIIGRLDKRRLASSEILDSLFLAAYSRRPTSSERKLMREFVAAYTSEKDAWPAVLWALLNSSEFALNH